MSATSATSAARTIAVVGATGRQEGGFVRVVRRRTVQSGTGAPVRAVTSFVGRGPVTGCVGHGHAEQAQLQGERGVVADERGEFEESGLAQDGAGSRVPVVVERSEGVARTRVTDHAARSNGSVKPGSDPSRSALTSSAVSPGGPAQRFVRVPLEVAVPDGGDDEDGSLPHPG